MTILIKNGTVVSATGSYQADVLIDGETIAAVVAPGDTSLGADLAASAEQVFDAQGKYVIPGGVDVHTHMELPFGGTFASDTFETGTRAAAWATPPPSSTSLYKSTGSGSRTPGCLAPKPTVSAPSTTVPPDHRRGRRRLVEGDGRTRRRGHHGHKLFMAYPGVSTATTVSPPGDADGGQQWRDDHDARRERIAIDVLVRQALAAGNTDPRFHGLTRPWRPKPRPRTARSCWQR